MASWEVTVRFVRGDEVTVNSDTEPHVHRDHGSGWVSITGVPGLPYVKRDEVLFVTVEKTGEDAS